MSAAAQSAVVLATANVFTSEMMLHYFEVFWPFLTGDVENDLKARAIDSATLMGEAPSQYFRHWLAY